MFKTECFSEDYIEHTMWLQAVSLQCFESAQQEVKRC